ncbi:hypothetical protein [Heyndrickxia camelliae]|uniref:Uncharacterized protein n=1 Tax=Heyndrickxia camelliae TaxID=1707093 RepID=A0A2N3LCF9_9BACI|nr:hypothetical protein [Heyndrickxia camelliae]PKR82350.1 hypothetical protein CWO92_24975 [Heyndrickxia camelliae]PKR82900.1 hypothetical protein CWO92_22175 [Heyndrickxia camelliae]
MRFKSVNIEECEICGDKEVIGIREGVTEDIGIGSYHGTKEFCDKCFEENTYTNNLGFTFLKFNKRLFCYKPFNYLDFGFREVVSEMDIDRAFNPDRYNFEKWLSNY